MMTMTYLGGNMIGGYLHRDGWCGEAVLQREHGTGPGDCHVVHTSIVCLGIGSMRDLELYR